MLEKFRVWIASKLTKNVDHRKIKDMDEENKHFVETRRLIGQIHREEMKALEDKLEQIKRQRQKATIEDEIADLYAEDEDEDEDKGGDFTDDLLKSVLPMFLGNRQIPTADAAANPPVSSAVELSDEEIQTTLQQFGIKEIKFFRKFPESMQRKLIQSRFPNLSESTIERAISHLKKL